MQIYNKKLDFFFIKFPILFPLTYLLILFNLPSYENFLIIFTILFLAEPHFAATYPILFDFKNKDYLLKKKLIFYLGSFLIIAYCFLGFFLFTNFFLLSFYAFNVFHVTRQSVGVCKLYNTNKKELNFKNNTIYLFNILFFIIGLMRFYLNQIPKSFLFELNLSIILLIIFFLIYYVKKFNYSENIFTLLSGIIIFYPICFVSNPVHAILLGVTIHYSQYLFITYKVYLGRKNLFKENITLKNFINYFKNKFFLIIIVYSIFMTILSILSKSNIAFYQNLILIPIIGQTLHFYFDSFIWKFSEEHNRNYTLKFIKEEF